MMANPWNDTSVLLTRMHHFAPPTPTPTPTSTPTSTSTDSDGKMEDTSEENTVLFRELIKDLNVYGVETEDNNEITCKIDCSAVDAARKLREWKSKCPGLEAKLVRMCDACGRSGIESEVVYCCLKCDGQYDECEKCHVDSKHHHQDAFKKHDTPAVMGTLFCFDQLRANQDENVTLGSIAVDSLQEIIGNINRCQPEFDIPKTVSQSSTDVGKGESPTKTDALVLFGTNMRGRLGFSGCLHGWSIEKCSEKCYGRREFVCEINLPVDIMPGQFVKAFQWRDWHRRTGGTAEIYSGCGGIILLEIPNYHISRE